MTVRDAGALLERLGIDRRARLREVPNGRDRRGRPYTKWVARYGDHTWSVRRELVADVQRALALVQAEDAEKRAAELRKAIEAPHQSTGTGPPK